MPLSGSPARLWFGEVKSLKLSRRRVISWHRLCALWANCRRSSQLPGWRLVEINDLRRQSEIINFAHLQDNCPVSWMTGVSVSESPSWTFQNSSFYRLHTVSSVLRLWHASPHTDFNGGFKDCPWLCRVGSITYIVEEYCTTLSHKSSRQTARMVRR